MKNKHPYYDSDRRRATEDFSIKAIGWCLVTMVMLIAIMNVIK